MWRWRLFAVFLLLAGLGLLAKGLHIEYMVHQRKGSGFSRWLAHVFYTNEIEWWREYTIYLLVSGPMLVVSGMVMWSILSWRKRVRLAHEAEVALLSLGSKTGTRDIKRALSAPKVQKMLREQSRGGKK